MSSLSAPGQLFGPFQPRRMGRGVDLLQLPDRDLRVDLRGLELGMKRDSKRGHCLILDKITMRT